MTTKVGMEEVQGFWDNESGQDLIEYALVAALLGLGSIVALKSLASSIGTVFGAVDTNLQTAI
jgi:pilus assembly protein Flp/PilA